ncbi:MAG TPA: hypothetical protein VLK58_12610 [Conexibacter sp.]|nr:hypothetical protein [Conexibacter sp.]
MSDRDRAQPAGDDEAPERLPPPGGYRQPQTPRPDHARAEDQPASGEPVTRVCRRCSTQTTGSGRFCPNCGARYERRRLGRRALVAIAALFVVLVGGGATTAVLVKQHNDDVARERTEARAEAKRRAEREREEARERAEEAAERRRRAARDRRNTQIFLRKTALGELRIAIRRHADELVGDGLLSGPILRTVCDPKAGSELGNLDAKIGSFSCMAVTETDADGTMTGYTYDGTINYSSGRMSWQIQR